ncbi:Ribonuclease III [Candidatus Bealeia paramacronuclearis]|uniref:Ribonuclease 3 n=1 Tax=Candidatus Bealeia paramacronuclearis TaxID=1921001 RepID=A0ABZ2C6M7_9PROT|nr:Ribonuclease III [Candidatus Bealeia paramacronuclearis]
MTITLSALEEWLLSQDLHLENPEALLQAFIHPSTRTKGNADYERLEFLGDRVLGIIIAHKLYLAFPREKEGALAQRFASLVNRETLAEIAEASGIAAFMENVIQETTPSQRRRDTILSDTCEAILGGLYLEGGLTLSERFIEKYWTPILHQSKTAPKDPKSTLQELLQKQGKMPEYSVLESTGPAHAPSFTIQISVPEGPSLQIQSTSKREGERLAAQEMLKVLYNVKS